MHIIISYESGEPIYEQIKSQLRGQILRGSIAKGSMLPSIRALAKELQIGIITAKRAYDDLCAEGFLYTLQGKGVFVADFDGAKVEDYVVKMLKEKTLELMDFARKNLIAKEKLITIINRTLQNGEVNNDK